MEAGSSWPQLLAAHPGQVPRPASQELLAPGFALLTAPHSLSLSVEWVPLAHRPPSYLPSEGSSITSPLPTAAPTSLLPLACPPHQQGPHQWGQPPVCCQIQAASVLFSLGRESPSRRPPPPSNTFFSRLLCLPYPSFPTASRLLPCRPLKCQAFSGFIRSWALLWGWGDCMPETRKVRHSLGLTVLRVPRGLDQGFFSYLSTLLPG